ncbi:hypothetical protein MLD38_012411 [Melastoma candidum]|uniref:Uncharacterized protein n=1 Tax=Melastoma candidum TaxID=119954 RepID=A0ACB9R696_9MYRT|nr:hypothetical protein MLD38_012411 [Melastoma candidum]
MSGLPALVPSSLLLSCSALLISSLVSNSHFFSSCLVEIMAFLCPLFVEMFLVPFALFTLWGGFIVGGSPGTRRGAVLGVCSNVLDKLRLNADEGIGVHLDASFEGSEVCRIIFEVVDLESGQHGTGNDRSRLA